MNTVEAIWMKSPSEVEDAKYDEFYKFIAKAYDTPLAKVRATHSRTQARTHASTHSALFFLAVLRPDIHFRVSLNFEPFFSSSAQLPGIDCRASL